MLQALACCKPLMNWANNLFLMKLFGRCGCIPERHRYKAFVLSSIFCTASMVLCALAGLSIYTPWVSKLPFSVSNLGSFDGDDFSGVTRFYVGLRGIKMDLNMTCNSAVCIVPMQPGGDCPGEIIQAADFLQSGLLTVPGGSTTSCLFKKDQIVSNTFTQIFDDVSCNTGVEARNENDYCKRCKTACWECFLTVVLTIVCIPFCIQSDRTRSNPDTDTNAEKFIGAICNGLGSVVTLYGLSTFAGECVSDLPTKFSVQGNHFSMAYHTGFGFYALVAAMSMLVLDGSIHLCISTPAHCWMAKEDSDDPDDDCEELVAFNNDTTTTYDSTVTEEAADNIQIQKKQDEDIYTSNDTLQDALNATKAVRAQRKKMICCICIVGAAAAVGGLILLRTPQFRKILKLARA